jgi:hypothetical protein
VSVRLLDWRLRGALVEARIPFRFGIAEMTELVHAVLFVTMEIDGGRALGVAADNLAPKWFTKDPETSYREDAAEMMAVIERACAATVHCGSRDTVFDLWHSVHVEQVVRNEAAVAPLLASFGVSIVERAAIDAFCRAKSVPFAGAVRSNSLGVRLEELHPELSGHAPREFLPDRPLTEIRVRHTVGLSDALVEVDRAGSAPADGLPATLEGCIRQYGVRRFKVKVGGDREVDLARLERVSDVLDRETGGDYRVTLDGNEQFADASALRAFWEELAATRPTAELAGRVDYVEQPLPRALSLDGDTTAELAVWASRPPLIIDESDDSLDAVVRAIDAGYAGGAFKSSKGVFKGIGNACRIEQLRRQRPERTYVYSAEDLSTIGPVGLLADLAVIASLGIDEPERNGYHYLHDLTSFSPRVQRETVRCHADLYAVRANGRPVLRIVDGFIRVESVVAAPFGVGWDCDIEEELPAAESLLAWIHG